MAVFVCNPPFPGIQARDMFRSPSRATLFLSLAALRCSLLVIQYVTTGYGYFRLLTGLFSLPLWSGVFQLPLLLVRSLSRESVVYLLLSPGYNCSQLDMPLLLSVGTGFRSS